MAVSPEPKGKATGRGRNYVATHTGPRWLLISLGTLLFLVAGVAGGLIVAATQSSDTNACSATNVADETLPSVVTIMVKSRTAGSTGSGEIIRSDGYILTNNHVISAAADGGSIEVLFSDGTTKSATLTGRDPQTDLAVIKVNAPESLPVIPFGSSSEAQVGQPVVALGAPLGLSSTVTTGIISALDRTIEVPSDNGKNALLVAAIQTDAAINPGNSGGALTDCSGNLIGVPSAGASVPNESGGSSSGDVGLGFAIPVSTAESVSNEIIETGHVTHSYLGIQAAQIPPSAAQQAGTSEGLYVVAVVPGGPSASAGLRSGDIITEINGEAATDPNQLTAVTLTEKPGDTVTITYERDGKSATAKVTLGTAP
jgi:putative serine protease PepD